MLETFINFGGQNTGNDVSRSYFFLSSEYSQRILAHATRKLVMFHDSELSIQLSKLHNESA